MMAEAKVEQSSPSVLSPSKITDFFTNSNTNGEQMLGSATASMPGPKKPRKGRVRAKPLSAKSLETAAAKALPAEEESQPLVNGATGVKSESAVSVSAKAQSKATAKPKREPAAKPRDATLSKAKKKEKDAKETEPQKPITDFFPVRRSDRRLTSRQLKKKREKDLEEKILRGCEDGLEVKEIEGKGRGVIAMQEFEKDEFVVEYAGDLVNITTAKQRESLYEKDEAVGCYMYYFVHKNKQYCIDATAESGKLGRLLNHSRKGNCYTKVIAVGDHPYLVLLASRRIDKGEELTYDYGDRSQGALESHPWLKL